MSKQQCPEFPFFGARYPDATCINGFLWDLDSDNGEGLLTHGGSEFCPFCNHEAYLDDHWADYEQESDTEEQARKRCKNAISKLHERHGYKPEEKEGEA